MHYTFTHNAWENFNKMQFKGVGKYEMPEMQAVDFLPAELVKFNYRGTAVNKSRAAVHFFMWDHLFQSVWRFPERHVESLKQFGAVIAPDFSLFYDFPITLQILACYRRQWLGAYWQAMGVNVVPLVSWSGMRESWEFCFDGVPYGSTVACQSVCLSHTNEDKKRFIEGYEEMKRRLDPVRILVYGNLPKEIRDDKAVCFPTCVEQFRPKKQQKEDDDCVIISEHSTVM